MENRETACKRGYGHQWRVERAKFLSRNRYCVFCQQRGVANLATVVDHVIPHKGDSTLFWDKTNWQPLCKHCHDSEKARQESEKKCGCDETGIPVDLHHHWREGGSNF